MTTSRRQVQGYLGGRSAVLLILLAVAGGFGADRAVSPVPFLWFSGVTAAAFAFTLLSALSLRKGSAGPFLTKLQPAWDVAYASALVFLSGGVYSPFSALYSLPIIGAAILFFRRGALVVATASSIAYGLLVDLQFYGILTPLNPFPLVAAEGASVALQLLFNLVAFYAVAVLSGYLAEELRRTGEKLKQAEAEVLDLEHLKELILQNLGSGLVALDRNGREAFHNRAAEELLQRAGIELAPGARLASVFDLSASERNEVSLAGGQVTFGYSVSPLGDRQGNPRGTILIFQDLSKVKRLEEELRRADRLAAVGRLAAGLAHEIRNPLASLAGSAEVLRQNLSPDSEDRQLFDIVLRETERLNQLVTDFLHYARPGRGTRAKVDLAALVDETTFFFAQGNGRTSFAVDNRVPAGTTLEGDRGQLEQLFLNLFRNSREAAPKGVRLAVEAGHREDSIQVSVSDDGPGMAPEVAERAFEPFFTSKENGTGLGLATVHRIVENHGGFVTLATEPGRGTAFHFRFPTSPEGQPSGT